MMEMLQAVGLFLLPAALVALVTMGVTRVLIGQLQARQVGKTIRADGPDHAAKAGTPTMGGMGMITILVIVGLFLALMATLSTTQVGELNIVFVIAAMIGFGIVGAADDRAGIARRRGDREIGIGLSARKMLALQTAIAAVIGTLTWFARVPQRFDETCYWCVSHTSPADLDPLFSIWVLDTPMAAGVWIALSVIVLLGIVNGVNLSDGLDGLASGLILLAFVSLGVVSSRSIGPMTAFFFCFAAASACAGFLFFNRHPARVFMGNVGSMGLGAALGTAALVTGTWALLPIIGAVFVAEVLSVIIQVGYYKYSGGKRVFRMAPLHHHFELGGMPETTVVRRFWLAGALAGAAGIAAAIAIIA